jgi:hypothetical protein
MGHSYWVLSDKTPDIELRRLSAYRNSDQDKNLFSDPVIQIPLIHTIPQTISRR